MSNRVGMADSTGEDLDEDLALRSRNVRMELEGVPVTRLRTRSGCLSSTSMTFMASPFFWL